MPVSLKDIQTITALSHLLYDFLPANPHPHADPSISFGGCAVKCGIGNLYSGGSKKNAINSLLQNTIEHSKGTFCKLMVTIVQTSLGYRNNKGNPISREEIEELNKKIAEIGFKIPELWNLDFLRSLPSSKPEVVEKTEVDNTEVVAILKEEFIGLNTMEAHARGYAFQDFLVRMFDAFGLHPKKSFRIVGEEIDGSFELGSDTYLLEAKWQANQSPEAELLIFSGKVAGKAIWSRGLFISYAGFTAPGLEAFARGKPTNLIGMDSQDIYFILEGRMSLKEALLAKTRMAAETNSFFTSVFNLANH
jgi:hypothetical protein